MAAILNILILGRNRWSDVVVPAIFEISIPKTPIGQSFMLLSGSAQLKQKLLHIRPTRPHTSRDSDSRDACKRHLHVAHRPFAGAGTRQVSRPWRCNKWKFFVNFNNFERSAAIHLKYYSPIIRRWRAEGWLKFRRQ